MRMMRMRMMRMRMMMMMMMTAVVNERDDDDACRLVWSRRRRSITCWRADVRSGSVATILMTEQKKRDKSNKWNAQTSINEHHAKSRLSNDMCCAGAPVGQRRDEHKQIDVHCDDVVRFQRIFVDKVRREFDANLCCVCEFVKNLRCQGITRLFERDAFT